MNIKSNTHPFAVYVSHHVPVALATDDEGVERTNLSKQYLTVATHLHFTYTQFKNLVRNSVYYSFMHGNNLWLDNQYRDITPVCAADFASKKLTSSCSDYLAKNEKAKMQWDMEKQLNAFEMKFTF